MGLGVGSVGVGVGGSVGGTHQFSIIFPPHHLVSYELFQGTRNGGWGWSVGGLWV